MAPLLPLAVLCIMTTFAFANGCQAKNYLQDSVCSFAHFRAAPGPSGTQRQTTPETSQRHQPTPQKCSSVAVTAGTVKNFAVCLSNFPSEIWPNIHFVFYPTGSSAKKRKRQATAEGEYEKDFIFPDYPSE